MVIVLENKPYLGEESPHFAQFPHELSDFQKHAIQHIVKGNHVFCNVPTGSGKTLPALFAISHFVKTQHRKVVYCSPIKSLSNQKYHEFTTKYPECSVGLITGDIKINQNADIVVCTTEILMNFLLNNAVNTPLQLNIDDIAMVILDECHYVFDAERGYVWETVIAKLPSTVQLLLLSGSFREPVKFCQWIEAIKTPTNQSPFTNATNDATNDATTNDQPINQSPFTNGTTNGTNDATTNDPLMDTCKRGIVCIIDKHRVVPLTHYSYITVNEGFFKKIKDKVLNAELRQATNNLWVLQDDKGIFKDTAFNKNQKTLEIFKNTNQYTNRKFVLNNVTTYLRENEMLPAIFFVFSRKLCEQFAKEITTNVLEDDSKIPYTIAKEYEQFMRKKLPNFAEYLELPEYTQLIKLLEKGIAYHHSGMLPILRELVEFAINANKVKVLFATESFGIGLNCAIKTTIFTQLKKHDGTQHRFLYSHEYLQMAGRAGRRGIDTRGFVIHLNNMYSEQPPLLQYKEMLKCQAPKMKSQFYISYNTILSQSNDSVCKSILEYEIQEQATEQRKTLESLRKSLDCKREMSMKTPIDTIIEYIDLHNNTTNTTTINTINFGIIKTNGKKQKELDKKMENLRTQYPTIVADMNTFREYNEFKDQYAKEEQYLTSLESYMGNQVSAITTILEQRGYIDHKASIAKNIHEIHPLVITDFIFDDANNMKGQSVEYIINLLSLWCDIKVSQKSNNNDTVNNDTVNNDDNNWNLAIAILNPDVAIPPFVKTISDLYNKYFELETEHNVDYKTNPDTINDTTYLGNLFEMWAMKCNTAEQCKLFIQTQLNPREISLGDFTKGCLKVVAIAKELQLAFAQLNDYIELAQRFSMVEHLLCKFIVTSQSLYV